MKKEKVLFLYPPTVYANHSMFKHFTYFGETIDVISRYCKNISVLDCAVEQIEQKVIFNNFKDLLKEGSIFNFYFIYKSDEDENKYVSKNIVKLDLYRKQVTTANGKVFHFVNEIG